MRTYSQENKQPTDANSEMTQMLGLSIRRGLEHSYHNNKGQGNMLMMKRQKAQAEKLRKKSKILSKKLGKEEQNKP